VAPEPGVDAAKVSGGASHEKLQKFGSQTVFGRPVNPLNLPRFTFNSLMPLQLRHWASVTVRREARASRDARGVRKAQNSWTAKQRF